MKNAFSLKNYRKKNKSSFSFQSLKLGSFFRHNTYRINVAKLNKAQARCIDISHEILDNMLKQEKEKSQLKPGRPPKIKNSPMNHKDIIEYFIKQN